MPVRWSRFAEANWHLIGLAAATVFIGWHVLALGGHIPVATLVIPWGAVTADVALTLRRRRRAA